MKCPSCGGSVQTREGPYHFKESGLDWVYLVGLEHGTCEGCGDGVVDLPDPEQLLDLIARTILERKRPLHGKEIRFLRSLIGWTQDRLGAEIGRGRVTVARWESGEKQILPQTDITMRIVWLHAYLAQKRAEGLDVLTVESLQLLNEWIYQLGVVIEQMRRATPGPEPVSINVVTHEVLRNCA